MGSLFCIFATSASRLALQRKQFGILHHADQDIFRAGDLLPLVVPVARRRHHVFAMRARIAGSFRRSISLASPPSCAQGGMKAEKLLNHAV